MSESSEARDAVGDYKAGWHKVALLLKITL